MQRYYTYKKTAPQRFSLKGGSAEASVPGPCTAGARHRDEDRRETAEASSPERYHQGQGLDALVFGVIGNRRHHQGAEQHTADGDRPRADQEEPARTRPLEVFHQRLEHPVLEDEAHHEDDPPDRTEAAQKAEPAHEREEYRHRERVENAGDQMEFLDHVAPPSAL